MRSTTAPPTAPPKGLSPQLHHLVRIGGLAGAVGGLLLVAVQVLEFGAVPYSKGNTVALKSGWYGLAQAMSMLAVVLIALGVLAVYLRQAHVVGSLGLAAFVVVLVGTVMYAGTVWSATFIYPTVAREAPHVSFVAAATPPTGLPETGILLSAAPFMLGWLLLAVCTIRARVLPRWPAVLLLVALPALIALPGESGTFSEVIGPALLGGAIAAVSWNAAFRQAGVDGDPG